jgi:hypothetical protein
MADPLDKATASPPPTLGEGCLARYDLDALGPQAGTDFPGAELLWQQLQQASGLAQQPAQQRPADQGDEDRHPGAAAPPRPPTGR